MGGEGICFCVRQREKQGKKKKCNISSIPHFAAIFIERKGGMEGISVKGTSKGRGTGKREKERRRSAFFPLSSTERAWEEEKKGGKAKRDRSQREE